MTAFTAHRTHTPSPCGFERLMQLLPHALPFVHTLQQAAADSGGTSASVTIGVRWPSR
jgi:hypothetical protein